MGTYIVHHYKTQIYKIIHSTLNCFSQVVTTSLLVNHTLVYFPSCDIVISMKSNIKEPFIVTEVQVYFTSIIQNKHFPCNACILNKPSSG